LCQLLHGELLHNEPMPAPPIHGEPNDELHSAADLVEPRETKLLGLRESSGGATGDGDGDRVVGALVDSCGCGRRTCVLDLGAMAVDPVRARKRTVGMASHAIRGRKRKEENKK